MPSPAHHRSRVLGTLGAAAVHTYMAVLGSAGFLNYTVPSRYDLLHNIAEQELWAWLFTGSAVLLVVSLMTHPYQRTKWINTTRASLACSIAFGIMFIWAFFTMLWGLSTTRPVSLAGPGLAFAVAAGEQLLAHAWNRGATTRDR